MRFIKGEAMKFYAKKFGELTNTEVYEILKSRMEVFLLEQKIVCLDTDDMDYESLHCFYKEEGRVVAYLRAFEKEEGIVKVGRVLTLEHGNGLGRKLMENSFAEIIKTFGCRKIVVDAQKQAEGFYAKLGFETVSGEFLEEGVFHVEMEKEI